MSHILALGGDAFALMLMWRARNWVFGRKQGMFETDTDAKMRKVGGLIVWAICIISIIANHWLLNF